MKSDLVSIIVIFRLKNPLQRDVTRVCFQGVRAFTKNYELIVLESQPDDISEKLAEPLHKEIRQEDRWITFDKNLTLPVSLNLGFKEAKGRFVYILPNDVLVHQNYLEELLKYYKPDSNIKVIGPMSWRPGSNIDYKNLIKKTKTTPIEEWETAPFNHLSGGWFMEKDTYEKIGPFDENFNFFYMDDDYRKRVNQLGYKCCFVPTSVVTHISSMTWFYDRDVHASDPYNIYNEGKDKKYLIEKWGKDG